MIQHYLTSALRNFRRHRVFSFINILSLSIGISAALVIFVIVYHELSFDRGVRNSNRTYRLVLDAKFSGTPGHSAGVPAPFKNALETEITGVQSVIPVFQFQGDATASVGVAGVKEGKGFFRKQAGIVFTDKEYFDLMPVKWLEGQPHAALDAPFSIVLTESRAHLYFPGVPLSQVVGKELTYNDELRLTVTGIVGDMKQASSLSASEFISWKTIANTNLQDRFMMSVWHDWMSYAQIYVQLGEGKKPEEVEKQLNAVYAVHKPAKQMGTLNSINFRLQPLADIHFNPNYQGGGQRVADKKTLYGLAAVGLFLLLLGVINFVNLSTAQASQRIKEIGIRKTMGGTKKQLIAQVMSETLIVTAIASAFSILLTPVLLKAFEGFIPADLHFSFLDQPSLLIFLVLLTATVTLLSGWYPALILSGYRPVRMLRNQSAHGKSRTEVVRKVLTVSQFVIAQFFVIGTMLVARQLQFSNKADMGFRKDAIITFDLPFDTVSSHAQSILTQIGRVQGVDMVSGGFMSPADEGVAFANISYEGKPDVKANVQLRWGDTNYLRLYGIPIVSGRNIRSTDNSAFIVNETYARVLGFNKPEQIIGKELTFNEKRSTVVGVMKDFHDQSFRVPIGPVAFTSGSPDKIHVRLLPSSVTSWSSTIASIGNIYKTTYPASDFEYQFYDQKLENLYKIDRRLSVLLQWSTGLTIIISCLGLVGLVIYTTHRRTKEIGVRKVLGARVGGIVSLLSFDFLKLVLIAFVIAAPLAGWAGNDWLKNFTYHTTFSWWIYIAGALIMVVAAMVALSWQTIRAARSNPVTSLRSE